jgi:hypothetical protein
MCRVQDPKVCNQIGSGHQASRCFSNSGMTATMKKGCTASRESWSLGSLDRWEQKDVRHDRNQRRRFAIKVRYIDFTNLMVKPPCSAQPRAEFLSNPRRIHSGQKDKEKEEYGLLCAVICFMSPLSPLQLPPPPHTAHLLHRLKPRYQD